MGPITLIGSAETSPGMVKVHRSIFEVLAPESDVVVIDTPYGFQENADLISQATSDYFKTSLNVKARVASLRDAAATSPAEVERFLLTLEQAQYLFAGPGSPSYALEQWSEVDAVRPMVTAWRGGAAITFASAAAVTAGCYAIPVYEIYKVGSHPFWLDGLDLLGATLGIEAVVIPHWNNKDGTHHDTSFCYLGRRRLDQLIDLLPQPVPIFGIDEHTAVQIHDGVVTVAGIGKLTVLAGGTQETIPSGSSALLGELLSWTTEDVPQRVAAQSETETFSGLLKHGDVTAAVDRIFVTLETGESADTKRMVAQLAVAAERGVGDPELVIAPFVDLIMRTRLEARARGAYDIADALRDGLVAAGIEINDLHDGSDWRLRR